ncbi:MAG: hypothetical protein SPL06_06455 [Bacteroidales bacterium]|nr:hypothetical protein [Bacteroidales bacterium]
MLWLIYVLWMIFVTVCAVIENKTKDEFYMFLILISIPVMFYIPFWI